MERQRCFEKNASLRGSILSVATPRREEGVGSIMYKMHWTSIGRHGKHAKKLPSTREAITPSRSSDVKNRYGKNLNINFHTLSVIFTTIKNSLTKETDIRNDSGICRACTAISVELGCSGFAMCFREMNMRSHVRSSMHRKSSQIIYSFQNVIE